MCNSECTRRLYEFYGGGITCGCEAIDLGSGSKIQFLCEEKHALLAGEASLQVSGKRFGMQINTL